MRQSARMDLSLTRLFPTVLRSEQVLNFGQLLLAEVDVPDFPRIFYVGTYLGTYLGKYLVDILVDLTAGAPLRGSPGTPSYLKGVAPLIFSDGV